MAGPSLPLLHPRDTLATGARSQLCGLPSAFSFPGFPLGTPLPGQFSLLLPLSDSYHPLIPSLPLRALSDLPDRASFLVLVGMYAYDCNYILTVKKLFFVLSMR